MAISLLKFFYIFKNVIQKQKHNFHIYMKRIIILYTYVSLVQSVLIVEMIFSVLFVKARLKLTAI